MQIFICIIIVKGVKSGRRISAIRLILTTHSSMASTSELIREFLAAKGPATAGQISLRLGKTSADIRHHLDQLVAAGWIEQSGLQSAPGAGRPASLYAPGPLMRAPGLAPLCEALLATLLALRPEDELGLLRQVAASLAGPLPANQNLSNRLTYAIRRLNQLGYLANWEARPGGARIRLKLLPFHELRAAYPRQIEQLDQFVIETLVGQAILRDAGFRSAGPVYSLKQML
jgi:predicted ArsR family transcriptional regulator